MSERDTAESASGQPNLLLTPDEKRVFGQLFQAADSEGLGVVTGELAVKFFEKSGLNPRILGEIWGIADTENRGLLTQVGFSVALRLIGQAQAGQHPRPELALIPGPLPRFEGVSITYPPTAPPPPTTSSPPPGHIVPTPTGGPRVPQLTEADCRKFTALFQVSGAVDGILPGDAAKGIFTRAKLPNQTLGLIWNLADQNQKGALTCPEFVVAMHLINCTKNGSLQTLPTVLPPALYDAASGRPPARPQERRPTGGRIPPPIPSASPIPKQFSGGRAQSPLHRQFTPTGPLQPNLSGGPPPPPPPGGEWAISPREKQEFDNLFNSVDRTAKGYITGEEAVPFFSNSKLPEDVLATIWDLADITKAGRLSKDEFAIAMYLIRQQRSRRDGQGLPETLPLNLIPPRMRAQLTGNVPPQQQYYQPPPAPPPAASAMDDLFGLDTFGSTTSAAAPNAPPATIQAFSNFDGAFQNPAKTGPPAVPPTQNPMFALSEPKFVPTSQFGQMLAASATGGSTSSLPARPSPSAMDDLLGGEDEQIKKITPDTMELANLSNQIGTLTKQTQELKNKRSSTEQELNTFNTQKQDIEARLAQIKSLYEREAKDVKMVEDRLTAARNDVIKLRQEYAITEASYNELAAKKQEIATQLEQDQRENLELKERMRSVNAENAQLKQQLEKLRLEAKQHKGLVAISKKQLATSEAERDKLKSEIDDLRSAAAASVQSPPPPGSPTPSQASTNPFYRARSPPATADSPYQSPYATGNSNFVSQQQQPQQTNYEDVFGPAFDSQPASVPPPPTTFSQTGQSGPSVVSASEGGPFDNSTPPTSPPASSYHNSPSSFDQPPPPSTASQMTSAFLPLPISRAESVTSSVQVNAPASTHDGSFSRPDTPTNWMNAPPPAVDSPARDIFAQTERRESTSVRSDPGIEGRPGFNRDDNRSPFAVAIAKNLTGPTTSGEEQKGHEKKESFGFSSPTPNLTALPGAFPPPLKPSATGESTRSNKSVSFAPRPDPFGLNRVDERAPTATKDDMDAAFASFGLPKANLQGQNTGGSNHSAKFDREFPPIEFPQDDDSDSDVGGGFDDDFTTASPRANVVPPTTNAPPEGTDVGSKPGTPLPAQKTADNNPFPLEGSSKSPAPSQFPAPPTTTKAPVSKPPVDDFDDAFGDLAPAQEADGKGDHDDFGTLATNDGFDEFNPVFDSPAAKAGGDKSVFPGDDDDFTRFNFNIGTPAQAQQQQHTGASNAKTASNDDWDRIFAGLEESKQPPTTAAISQGSNPPATGAGEGNVTSGTGTDPVSNATGGSGDANSTGVDEHEEKLTILTGMGFSRESSMKALEKFKFSVEPATNYLLDNN